MKKCKKCCGILEENDFYRNHDECKTCWNKYCSDRRKRLKEKDPTFLEKRRKYLQDWRKENKEKNESYWKKSFTENRDKINERRRTPERRKVNNEAVKNWRKNNPERFAETEKIRKDKDRIKGRARRLVYKHIMRGHIQRLNKCSKCLKECKPEAHHDDYSKPLEITWLCRICHKKEHGKLLDVK